MSSPRLPSTQNISHHTGARNLSAPPEIPTRPLLSRSTRTLEQTQQHFTQAEKSLQSSSANLSPALPTVFDNDPFQDVPYQTPDSSPRDHLDQTTKDTCCKMKMIEPAKGQREESSGRGEENYGAGPLSWPGIVTKSRSNSSPTPPSKQRSSCLNPRTHDRVRSAPNLSQDQGDLTTRRRVLSKKTSRGGKAVTAAKDDDPQNDIPSIDSPHIKTLPRERPLQETPPETPPTNTPQPDPLSPDRKPKFKRFGEERRLDSINMHIHELLLKNRTPKKSGSREAGWTYIYESPSYAEGHVKVGHTERQTSRRIREWQKCKFPIQELEDTDRDAFDHSNLVESLIKEEFHNERMTFTCDPCKQPHNEWFKTDKEPVIKSRNRWRCWLKTHKPYDSRGVLTPYWRWKVMSIKKQASKVDWDAWTNPWWFDGFLYRHQTLEVVLDHWGRHGKDFWLRGVIVLLLLYMRFGSWEPFLWGFVALLFV